TWTWAANSLQHSVLSSGTPSFPSSMIQASGSYAFTFTAPGTYRYICAVHGASMSGTIVVRLAAQRTAALHGDGAPRGGVFAQRPRGHVVHEPPHRDLARHPGVRTQLLELLPHVVLHVAKGVEVQRGDRGGLPLPPQPGHQLLVAEREHAAVGVIDDHPLLGAEQVVRDEERADDILRHDTAGIADHVGVARLEAERLLDREPGVHAGDDR